VRRDAERHEQRHRRVPATWVSRQTQRVRESGRVRPDEGAPAHAGLLEGDERFVSKESEMRIVVDREKCSGLGMCEGEAEDLFQVQEDGSLEILDETPSEDRRDAAEAAVESCPTEALSIVED
jgi:ferredoxin